MRHTYLGICTAVVVCFATPATVFANPKISSAYQSASRQYGGYYPSNRNGTDGYGRLLRNRYVPVGHAYFTGSRYSTPRYYSSGYLSRYPKYIYNQQAHTYYPNLYYGTPPEKREAFTRRRYTVSNTYGNGYYGKQADNRGMNQNYYGVYRAHTARPSYTINPYSN